MVVMVTGPSFNNISWGTYIGTLAVVRLCLHRSHPRTSFRRLERIHRTHRVPVFPRDCWSLARGCVRALYTTLALSDAFW